MFVISQKTLKMELKNKTAFITGGTTGIGYGIAKRFLAEGMNVAITSRSQAHADQAVTSLKEMYPTNNIIGLMADVKNFESQQRAVHQAESTLGTIDVVIANAGVGHFASVEEITVDQWQDVIETNLTGAFYTLKTSLDSLKKSKGYYITISSLAGANFFAKGSAYNASKFGVTGFTQAAMLDMRKYDIKVSTIMPGSVATHFNGHTPSEADAWKIQPQDIAEIAVDLLKMNARTLPSKIEVRPSRPDLK